VGRGSQGLRHASASDLRRVRATVEPETTGFRGRDRELEGACGRESSHAGADGCALRTTAARLQLADCQRRPHGENRHIGWRSVSAMGLAQLASHSRTNGRALCTLAWLQRRGTRASLVGTLVGIGTRTRSRAAGARAACVVLHRVCHHASCAIESTLAYLGADSIVNVERVDCMASLDSQLVGICLLDRQRYVIARVPERRASIDMAQDLTQ